MIRSTVCYFCLFCRVFSCHFHILNLFIPQNGLDRKLTVSCGNDKTICLAKPQLQDTEKIHKRDCRLFAK